MKLRNHTLHKELRSVGASTNEATQLVALAQTLALLNTKSEKHGRSQMIWVYVVPGVVFLFLGIMTVVSQSVLPGSWLYPLQRTSDAVATTVDHNYRGTVMMRRARQVKLLILSRHSEQQVLATLTAYQTEAAAYKVHTSNYAVFEYCKNNLEQAVLIASPVERQAITNTLRSLQDV